MNLYTSLQTITPKQNRAVALGFFDGVHLGHQVVIGRAVDYATQNGLGAAVFTFRLADNAKMKQGRICKREQKREILQALGVQACLEPAFEEFCRLSPEEFVQDVLHDMLGATAVFCGDNFAFGKQASGNIETLKTLCEPLNISVNIVSMAQYEGNLISSSRIRRALAAGNIPAANAMLGRPYCIDFPVVHGKGLGHTLGFPTINQIYPEGFAQPKQGIYITRVKIGEEWHPAATGFGTRPTVDDSGLNPTCETFIPNFAGDLYETAPKLEFHQFLAPTQKFETLQALADCVQNAAAKATAYFADENG